MFDTKMTYCAVCGYPAPCGRCEGSDDPSARIRGWADTPVVQQVIGDFGSDLDRITRERDAARMILGPLSKRPDLLDACDDVVREIEHLRRVVASKNELINRLVTELGHYKGVLG
jgi:hypothetical protein